VRGRSGSGEVPSQAEWFVVGTHAAGSSLSVSQAGAGSSAAIGSVDRHFNADAFLAWSHSVYERATEAWRDRNPELLRPVMAEHVWDHYARFLLAVSVIALGRELMASAVAEPTFTWARVDSASQSVLVSFSVTIAGPRISVIDDRARHWQERWLFQRPAGSRTHASGMVAVCLVCGGPADPADSGQCSYCQADITTRTAGWLVTEVATTMPGAPRIGRSPVSQAAIATPAAGAAAPAAATPLQPPRAL
jgi:hypothetical protein